MCTRPLAMLGAVLFLAACDPSAPAPTAPPALADAQHAVSHTPLAPGVPGVPERPFKGSCELQFEVLGLNFPILRQRDWGVCQLTHLGRTQFDGILEINLLAGTQNGTRTLTAANGDELYATVAGTSAPIGPGLIAFSATLTFTGGTGRFASASGSALAEGVANQMTKTSSVSLSGSIRY